MQLKTNLSDHRCDESFILKTHLSWSDSDIITLRAGVPFPFLLSVFLGLVVFGEKPVRQAM